MTVYNYNINKDLRAIRHKIKMLEEVKPYLSKTKQKVVISKISSLEKELKKFSK